MLLTLFETQIHPLLNKFTGKKSVNLGHLNQTNPGLSSAYEQQICLKKKYMYIYIHIPNAYDNIGRKWTEATEY
jgi:hypothetical protein